MASLIYPPMSRDNLLIVADSERDADMLFAVGMFIPEPFIFLRLKGRCYIIISDSELERARKGARHCRVLSLNSCCEKLKKAGMKLPGHADVIADILREHRIKKVTVPASFPHGLARELRDHKIKVEVPKGPLFPNRERKTAEEVKKISAALVMAEVGLSEGIQALKSAKAAKDGRLLYHNVPLTSEKLRSIIDISMIQAGGLATHTIVAGGRQGSNLHEQGHGPLRANQTIIIDVFPRSQKTGYFGDITRTVVKGRASEAVRKLYFTVKRGQELAFSELCDGKPGTQIHQAIQKYFRAEGYKTCKQNGRMEGFIHGTGHGVGLEVQEAPRIGPSSRDTLRAGHVVTIAPGLYYPSIGNVRIEDVVLITTEAARNLTEFEKVLEV
jgi:Xaa-Pro aminopeptidase